MRIPGHNLTRATEAEYWRLLRAASAIWAAEQGFEALDAAQRAHCREFFHERALPDGLNKSLTVWTDRDVDRVFAYLAAYAKGGHIAAAFVDLDAAEENGHRRRLLHRVERYRGHGQIVRDLTGNQTDNPEALTTPQLEKLARTCSERLRAAARQLDPAPF